MHIYPCNICPCDICPYQEYLSCQWPDFETSLANYYPFTLDNLRQLSNGHFSMQHLSLLHLSISGISQLSLTQFWPEYFLGPLILMDLKTFKSKNIFRPYFLGQKNFLGPKFLGPQIVGPKNFWTKTLWGQIFSNQQFV